MDRSVLNACSCLLFSLCSAFNDSTWRHIDTAFQVEVNGLSSGVKHRYSTSTGSGYVFPTINGTVDRSQQVQLDASTCIVVPFWTIVLNVDQGTLTSVEFDDDCSLCDTDHCVDGNCAQEVTSCSGQVQYENQFSTTADCDFKLYVAWSGTDSDGNYLSSASRRLSQFRRWSIRSAYNSASQINGDALGLAPPSDGPSFGR
jgi:hypothetical protein